MALALLLLPLPARAAESPGVRALTAELASSTPALERQAGAVNRLEGLAPADAFANARLAMQAGAAGERFRDTVRKEQRAIYVLAGNPTVAAEVEARLGRKAPPGLTPVLAALRALFRLAGVAAPLPVDEYPYNSALPLPVLEGYYQGAARGQGLDWKYLAAINFLESTFGRNTSTSPAGAQGPMQFIPSTWVLYGHGGNILDPHDAIYTAARYLRAMGAPADYPLALHRYNDDDDYVAAVADLVAAIGVDGLWVQRLYYWDTYG